jgi:hypothetical protein
MEVSSQLDAPVTYPQGKSPRYPLDRRLGGPQSRSGRGGEEKDVPSSAEHQPGRPSHILVTILTELRLHRNNEFNAN